jgi:hypothetical protein
MLYMFVQHNHFAILHFAVVKNGRQAGLAFPVFQLCMAAEAKANSEGNYLPWG